jgi:hypothetical protein
MLELGTRFSVARDQISAASETLSALEAAGGPVHLVMDLREMRVSFDDLMHAVNFSTRGQGNILHHQNVAGIVVVTTNPVLKLAGKGLNSEIFGHIRSAAFDTPEEALAHARQQVSP